MKREIFHLFSNFLFFYTKIFICFFLEKLFSPKGYFKYIFECFKPGEDFSLAEQLKAKMRLVRWEESHNGSHFVKLENISIIKAITLRPLVKDERAQQRYLTPKSISSAARVANINNSVNQSSPNGGWSFLYARNSGTEHRASGFK